MKTRGLPASRSAPASGSTLDLAIKGGLVVTEEGAIPLDVGVEGEHIAALESPGALGAARRELDATGMVVMPGAIDVHFHCRAPSHPERGDFASETAAAVSGGVTTVFEMPISLPACSTPEVLAQRRALIEAQARCNVALYSGAVVGGTAAAEAMAEAGAIGFKLFTISPPPGREAEFSGLWTTDESEMYDVLAATAQTGLRCVCHAEHERLLRRFGERPRAGVDPRPPLVEAAAVGLLGAISLDLGAPVHIAHVSSTQALAQVRGARAAGAPLSAETCPQYLTLDTGTIERHGGVAKIGPPLRAPDNSAALWDALTDGSIDLVSSDHSPFLLSEKAVDYRRAPMGLPTVELLVPVVLDAWQRGLLSLERAVGLLATNPARLFGLYPRKGVIALGADADLAVVNSEQTFRPTAHTLRSRAAGCAVAFGGIALRAKVKSTVVGGRIVYSRSRPGTRPNGRFVPGGGIRT